MKDTFGKWGVATRLTQLGIKEEEVETIAANEQQMGPTGNLKKLSRQDIEAILKLAL